MGSVLNSGVRKQHNDKAQVQQEEGSNNNTITQVPKSIPIAPVTRNRAQTPTPQAPPQQIHRDTTRHTHRSQTTSHSQQVAVDVQAAGESPHPVPPSHLEDHPNHHNPTTQNTCRKRELLATGEYTNEGQQSPGITHNPQKYKTDVTRNIDTTHQHHSHTSNTTKVTDKASHIKHTISKH